ncbi:riboflavin biosynthesis protein RibD [Longibacter salinarum]|uniref:Riboflavin biosynthesis protein RibD n=1 Tax=Longibacter salinarum TaxID=1850348 RepID=A0A2A8CUZ0_9BACT|nr:bifunctional diaminohydroxyphosphoribosylaminopyrimidine deaminase/5-amino-6-(5-phosphoribosylamino)uracil reductase RibD [Longibacter salinarum]PEN12280.1 riboflavin biosynthesis protein RibD [Longibacter salinarum]
MAAEGAIAPGLHRGSVTPRGDEAHEHWMQRCLDRARRGAGSVSPNPLVGAVIVGPDGSLLAEGWHETYGGPHAEANAVRAALDAHGADALRDATLYVNLEPCSHHGKTPPCTDLVLEAGIPRLVVGTIDPFPAVKGRGIRRLREHGVDVELGVLENECARLNEAFFHHVCTGRPLVTLKVAQTVDGRVATASGDSRWISGKSSRTLVHRWRSEVDGVLVGAGTAEADDPRLTVRHVKGRQPMRLVLDRHGRLPADLRLFTDDHVAQTIVVTATDTQLPYAGGFDERGGRVLRVAETETGHLNLRELLETLGQDGPARGNGAIDGPRPVQSLLVEAGPGLATALFQQDLVDRYFCFIAPKVSGRGMPTTGDLGTKEMRDALTFDDVCWEAVGNDMLLRGYRRSVGSNRQSENERADRD